MRRLLLLALLASCAGRAEPEPVIAPPPTAESELDHEPDPPPVVEPEPPPPEPAPAITLTGDVSRYGAVSISVANRSDGPSRFALHLLLEREVDHEFVAAEDLGAFEIGASSDGGCAELLSGGELRETWGCLRGDQRGGGEHGCAPATAGRYRFVATSCDGRSRTEGPAFAYP